MLLARLTRSMKAEWGGDVSVPQLCPWASCLQPLWRHPFVVSPPCPQAGVRPPRPMVGHGVLAACSTLFSRRPDQRRYQACRDPGKGTDGPPEATRWCVGAASRKGGCWEGRLGPDGAWVEVGILRGYRGWASSRVVNSSRLVICMLQPSLKACPPLLHLLQMWPLHQLPQGCTEAEHSLKLGAALVLAATVI
jgi:hypothetical protein